MNEEWYRRAWARLNREQQTRALRFGARPARERDRRRQLDQRNYSAVSLTPPEEVESYLARFRPVFVRSDTLRQAVLYMIGLLSGLERKNGETMEAAVPGARQRSVWDFLVRSPWLAELADRLRVFDALQQMGLADRRLNIVIDEVGWRKKGKQTVGVARQYLGCIGKVDNGQVAVTLHGCCTDGDLPLTGELYLNEAWAADTERREAARVPTTLKFRTKPQIALALIDRVLAWGLLLGWIHADAGYGDLGTIQALRERNLRCSIAVRANARVRLPGEEWIAAVPPPPYAGHGRPRVGQPAQPRRHLVGELHAIVPSTLWRDVPYRIGVNGHPLTAQFVALRAHLTSDHGEAETEELWLLLERPSAAPGTKQDLKQYVITGPDTMSVDELAQVAHGRPIIERNSYENAKQEAGLDEYQGRSWIGFHHHLAMVWFALTWLMLQRRPLPPPPLSTAFSSSDTPAPVPPPTEPPSFPASPVPLPLAAGTAVPVVVAIPTRSPLPLPRQLWESVQEVRRRLIEWFAGMRFREHLFAALGIARCAALLRPDVFPPLRPLGPISEVP